MFWCLEASKRGNDRVTSLQETNKKLLETLSELKKASSTASPSPSASPVYPFPSELPGPDFFLFQLFCFLLLPFPQQKRIKKKKKIRSDYSSFKEKPITGRNEPSLVFIYISWTQTELRALAKEFPDPSQGPLGFAKEFESTIWSYEPGFRIYIN